MFTAKRWFLKLKTLWNNFVIRTASPFITLRIRSASSQWLCIRQPLCFLYFVIRTASPFITLRIRFASSQWLCIRQILSAFFASKKLKVFGSLRITRKAFQIDYFYLKGFFSEQVVPLVIPQLHYYFVYTSYGKPVSY